MPLDRTSLVTCAGAVTAGLILLGVGLAPDPGPPAAPATIEQTVAASTPARVAPRGETEAAAVLSAWDGDRARAWARGDLTGLRRLYTAGSSAGGRDVARLRRWVDRGLRVTGQVTQVLALRVRERERGRLVVVVTDRVVGARAVGRGLSVGLPASAPSQRVVTLVRRQGRWLVASVSARR
jgi:hypothetical protein